MPLLGAIGGQAFLARRMHEAVLVYVVDGHGCLHEALSACRERFGRNRCECYVARVGATLRRTSTLS